MINPHPKHPCCQCGERAERGLRRKAFKPRCLPVDNATAYCCARVRWHGLGLQVGWARPQHRARHTPLLDFTNKSNYSSTSQPLLQKHVAEVLLPSTGVLVAEKSITPSKRSVTARAQGFNTCPVVPQDRQRIVKGFVFAFSGRLSQHQTGHHFPNGALFRSYG